ncbi:glycine receptor subunit alpha-4-like isoform X2 [Babylonia areolata]|uniref:glycine receptor subunit alpha-4-like isoform X2 n=1 Tax=Babylonia areolata TaxID=304850 RepID=UPI003FD42B52
MVSLVFHALAVVALTVLCGDVTQSLIDDGNNNTRLSLLNSMLDKDKYDARVPPDYEKNVATNVTIKIHLLSFDSVSETKMDYSVELFLTQEWFDARLNFGNVSDLKWLEVDSKMMDDVWVPDVYFRNEKSASFHDVTVPNKYMHLYPGGRVVYSVRLSLTLNCRMDLIKYPLDSQDCPMWIQSYTYTTENVMFYWDPVKPIVFDQEMEVHTELPQFSLVSNRTIDCKTTKDKDDEPSFACIVAQFTLQRDIRYYIIQVYVPSILIVALSWVSFWLDLEAIPARVSLGVLTVLTLNTHGSTIQAALPKVSYIKAIDVWVVSSLIFVFAALLEFAYVNVLARRADKELAMAEVLARTQLFGHRPQVNGEMNRHIYLNGSMTARARARRVDKISRIVFPVLFSVFNVVYWVVYIHLI